MDQKSPYQSGIYAIFHTLSKRAYVGSAKNIITRWRQHLYHLHLGVHHSKRLQKAWSEYGVEAFEFRILEIVSDLRMLRIHEQAWMDKLKSISSGFNAQLAASKKIKDKKPKEPLPEVDFVKLPNSGYKAHMHMYPIERTAQGNLIRLALAWCEATNNTLSAAGRVVVGDSRFFPKLIERYQAGDRKIGDRQGSITFRVYDEAVKWFNDISNWPEELAYKIPQLDDLAHNISCQSKDEIYGKTEGRQKQAKRRECTQKISSATGSQGEGRKAGRDGSAAGLLAKLRRDSGV